MAQSMPTEQNLKTAHDSFISAITSGNLAMAQAMIHPRAIGFFLESVKIVELRPDYGPAEALPAVIKDLSQFNQADFETSYRVLGSTGIICVSRSLEAKKWSKTKDLYTRSTFVYVQTDGNWKLISWHTSNIPLK
jgi:hypothetical protein